MDEQRFAEYAGALGIEPLDQTFTASQLSGVLRGSSQPVKKVLMDQRKIAGIGNIYANEALWRAGIDPSRAAKLYRCRHSAALLRDEIVLGSPRSRSRRAARAFAITATREASAAASPNSSRPTDVAASLLRCGLELILTHAIDGRATVFCAHCQS